LAERQKDANWHDMPYHERFVQTNLIDSDGAAHHRLRRAVFGAFSARALTDLEPEINAYIEALLRQLTGRETVDFIADFAAKVPLFVICTLVGIPLEDGPQISAWTQAIVDFFDMGRDPEKKRAAEAATQAFTDYLTDLRAERSATPRADLFSKLIVQDTLGHLKGDELIATTMLILMAGQGSTTDVLGSGLHTLLRYPDAMGRLRMNRTLLPSAIAEMFRYEPPLPFFHRHATEDVNIRGHSFPAGTTFGLLYGSANRDPAQFEDADRFMIERSPNRHLAFGHGAHLCLGNHLARLNMRLIFSQILDRFADIQLVDSEVRYKPGLSVRGPHALRIKWE